MVARGPRKLIPKPPAKRKPSRTPSFASSDAELLYVKAIPIIMLCHSFRLANPGSEKRLPKQQLLIGVAFPDEEVIC